MFHGTRMRLIFYTLNFQSWNLKQQHSMRLAAFIAILMSGGRPRRFITTSRARNASHYNMIFINNISY